MSRRLVLCFDGTWNTPDTERKNPEERVETNARRIYESVAANGADGKPQYKWYDEGVGTKWYNRIRGGTMGVGLDTNIKQGYRFLVQNYRDGDEVYLFGFSRGAYSARSLVGFIRNCGLLKDDNRRNIDAAYELYRTRDEGADTETAIYFRQNYSRDIRIKCLGVWDTVGALGIPIRAFGWFNRRRYEFHDTELSSIVDHAYHATAIDEHRKDYDVTLWRPKTKPSQTMEQRWFLGAHADVGGGYEDRTLSDITLAWMQDAARKAGLEMDKKAVAKVPPTGFLASITDSYHQFLKGIYSRFNPRHYRPILQTQYGNEQLDTSVVARREKDPNYRPRNPGIPVLA